MSSGDKESKNLWFEPVLIIILIITISSVSYYRDYIAEPTEADYTLHSIVLEQVNTYRGRSGLEGLDYDADPLAQNWAWRLMSEDALYHNPELPSNMGENIAVYTEHEIDPKVAIALMVERMVNDDARFNNANRANILNPDYDELAIGVAVEGDSVYLVLCFS